MAHCVFRCVENRVSAVRATNTGITCFIDRRGRIVSCLGRAEGPLPDPDYLMHAVTLPPADMPLTFYTRHGDVLAQGCAAFTLTLLAGMVWGLRKY
jgi:apolipoprotein N-acyltransferase